MSPHNLIYFSPLYHINMVPFGQNQCYINKKPGLFSRNTQTLNESNPWTVPRGYQKKYEIMIRRLRKKWLTPSPPKEQPSPITFTYTSEIQRYNLYQLYYNTK